MTRPQKGTSSSDTKRKKASTKPKAKKPAAPAKTKTQKAKPKTKPKAKPKATKPAASPKAQQPKKAPRSVVPRVAALLILLGVVYLAGSLVFASRYLPGTTINGRDVSLLCPADLAAHVQDRGSDSLTRLEGHGLELSLWDAEIGLTVDPAQYCSDAAQYCAGWSWPLQLLSPRDFEVTSGTSFDDQALVELVTQAVERVNLRATHPVDATVSYDQKKAAFVAVREQEGNAIELNAVLTLARKAVTHLQRSVRLTDNELEHPVVFSDDQRFSGALEQANERASVALSLSLLDTPYCDIDSELLRSWFAVSPDYRVTGNLDAIEAWTRGELSSQIDTVGTMRSYTRPDDGKVVEVAGGDYGWNVDGVALAQTIADHLTNNESGTIEIPLSQTAAVLVTGGQDWGNRYIDVDLSEQVVRFYSEDGGLLCSSSCVSGDVAQNNDTITGVYALLDKESPSTLRGPDDDKDGEPDWENDVSYWMPFCGAYGLHDAEWRSYFGGTIYQTDGSHGCVNLPVAFAGELYNLVQVGDPVVVHY